MLKAVKPVQYPNASSPIVVTDSGIVIAFKTEQPEKAPSPRLVIVFGSGVIVYFIYAKLQHKWPYKKSETIELEHAIETIGE